MANRRQQRRKQRRTRSPRSESDGTAGVEAPVEPEEGSAKTPAERKPHRTRFGAWADRLEETADERPPAPWGNFPLGPLAVLAGLALIVIGALGSNPVQLAIGVALGALGGLELSIREHFAGFRSHTTLLAGFVFVIAVGLAYYAATIILWASLLIGFALAIPAFWWLRKSFEKASGGLSYRIR